MNYVPYQPYSTYPNNLSQQQMSQLQPQVGNNLIWVQGEAAANAYLTAPNSVVWLMDSTAPRLYVKRTDGIGKPYPLEKYRLVNENDPEQQTEYVTAADLEKRLSSFMDEISSKFVIRKPRKEQSNG